MGRKQETLLFAVDSKLPRGTGASKTLKKVGSLWRRLALNPETLQQNPKPFSTRPPYEKPLKELHSISWGPYKSPSKEPLRDLNIWDFPKIRVPYFGVLIIRILLFRVLY